MFGYFTVIYGDVQHLFSFACYESITDLTSEIECAVILVCGFTRCEIESC